MDEILINIIPFKGKPFSSPIKVWQYFAHKKLNWAEIGWKIRIIRQLLRSEKEKIIVFQNGNTLIANRELYSIKTVKLILDDFIESNDSRILDINSTEDLTILQRLLGEAFSDKLRKLTRHAYKVVEKSNAVYYATHSTQIADFNEIEIWPGFQYTPLIQKDGAAGMIIDPRSQYHTKQTLRDVYDSKFDLSKELDLYKFHIDICPIDCPEKRDPLSTCLHSGAGQSITISKFIQKSPSEVMINFGNEKINLIDFHNREKNCPKKMLGSYIEDKSPVAVSNFGYHYPLERIRRSPYSNLIKNEDDRRKLNRLVTLNPIQRYKKTVNMYAPNLDGLRINENLVLHSTGELISQNRDESFKVKSGYFPPRKLLLASCESFYPVRDLIENGPFKKPKDIQTINAVILNIGNHEKVNDFNSLFSCLITGNYDSDISNKWKIDRKFHNKISFPSFLKTDLNVVEKFSIKNAKDFELLNTKILELKKKYDKNILAFLCIGRNSDDLVIPIKKFLTLNRIPNQGLNISTLLEKISSQQISYFQNIILGGFCKISGVPWAIDSDKSLIYIGYNGKFYEKDKVGYSIASFDSKGIWLKGTCSNIDRDEFSNQLKSDLLYIMENRDEVEIRFYANGVLKDLSEYPVIIETLQSVSKKFVILEIINNPLRIYNVSDKGWYSANRGSYMKILPNQICLVTTFSGRQGTPNPILVKLRKGNNNFFEDYLNEVFLLTHSYPGYIRINTRYPSPVHAARAILSDSNNLEISDFTFEIPWFI